MKKSLVVSAVSISGLAIVGSTLLLNSDPKPVSSDVASVKTMGSCPPEGRERAGSKKTLNPAKREFNKRKNKDAKEPGTVAKIYSIEDILQGKKAVKDKDAFKEGTFVEINDAYLLDSKEQDGEDCNCYEGSGKDKTGDLHINLVNKDNLEEGNKDFTVVVEITPSYKKLHAGYSAELKALKGKKVRVKGYLFYDDEHKGNSVNYCTTCSDVGVWRKTCWEIHPVTFIGEAKK